MTKIAQILVAAGQGARFSSDVPKQYVQIHGKTLLRHTLDACAAACPQTEVFVIVVAPDDQAIHEALEGFGGPYLLVTGGATRTQSARAGVMALSDINPELVFIHDAARPFVTAALYDEALRALGAAPAVVPVLPIVDAVKTFQSGEIGKDVDRQSLRRVQTPQGFVYDQIKPLYAALGEEADFSDDIAIARDGGLEVAVIDGAPGNIKITYPGDLRAFEVTRPQSYSAIGSGFDVHRTEPGDHVWLCGVRLDAEFGLSGHSDADVGLHAITDAILGAISAGDIGDHFPPTDPKWKGASSDQFLEHAARLTQARGGRIMHVDVTLICERPKIGPHKQAMRARIAEILSLEEKRVSVKATTSERLGFTGRGEGIAAQAVASINLPEDSHE